MKGVMVMNCENCGAPLGVSDEFCAYCGSITPYGKSLQEERRMPEVRGDLPKMKHVSVAFMIFAYVFTLGWYASYWYATRMMQLIALTDDAKKKLGVALGAAVLALSFLGMWTGKETLEWLGLDKQTVFNYSVDTAIIVSLYLGFVVRSILQSYAAGLIGRNVAVGTIAPSGVMLVLFGAVYLQHGINRMMKMKLLAPKL